MYIHYLEHAPSLLWLTAPPPGGLRHSDPRPKDLRPEGGKSPGGKWPRGKNPRGQTPRGRGKTFVQNICSEIGDQDPLENDPLKQAIYYFIINRCSFSGATLSGGFSQEASKKRFTQSSIQRISNLNLTYIEFFNMDF